MVRRCQRIGVARSGPLAAAIDIAAVPSRHAAAPEETLAFSPQTLVCGIENIHEIRPDQLDVNAYYQPQGLTFDVDQSFMLVPVGNVDVLTTNLPSRIVDAIRQTQGE